MLFIMPNIVDKVIKHYFEIYSPHKKLLKAIVEDKKLVFTFVLILVEIIMAEVLLYFDLVIYSFIVFIIFLTTVSLSAYRHFKHIEDQHGSADHLDEERRDEFKLKIKNKVHIDIEDVPQNILLDEMIKEKKEGYYRQKQKGLTWRQGLSFVLLGYFLQLVVDFNPINSFIVPILVIVGSLVLSISSLNYIYRDYTTLAKLDRIGEILKEIRMDKLTPTSNR